MTPAPVPDRWMVVEVDRPVEEWHRDLIVDVLSEMTGRGAEEQDGVLRAYLPGTQADAAETMRAVTEAIEGLVPGAGDTVRFAWQPHEDWVEIWRAGVEARRVTPRIVISPTWDPHEADGDEIVVRLDPGVAFGTAEHATTRGCLRLLERSVRANDRIADLGSGSGILAIAAAKLGAASVLAIDSDPLACGTARENIERNEVSDRVSVEQAVVDGPFLARLEPFDGVVANIETGVLVPLVPDFRAALRGGGWLILSGIQADEADRIVEAAAGVGLALTDSDQEPGWWTGSFSGS